VLTADGKTANIVRINIMSKFEIEAIKRDKGAITMKSPGLPLRAVSDSGVPASSPHNRHMPMAAIGAGEPVLFYSLSPPSPIALRVVRPMMINGRWLTTVCFGMESCSRSLSAGMPCDAR